MKIARTEFILYIATSIDGYIARSDGSVDWLPAPEENSYAGFYNSIDAKLDLIELKSYPSGLVELRYKA